MFLFDYTNDLGVTFKFIKPFIRGLNIVTNEIISTDNVLLEVSNYIPINGYYEFENVKMVCQIRGRPRRIILRFNSKIYELDYYEPFYNLDWSVFESERVRVEVIPEFINNNDIETLFIARLK